MAQSRKLRAGEPVISTALILLPLFAGFLREYIVLLSSLTAYGVGGGGFAAGIDASPRAARRSSPATSGM